MTKKTVLAIGIEPSFADFGAVPGLTPELVRNYIEAQIERLSALGFDAASCLTDLGDTAEAVVATALLTPTRDAPKRSAPAPQPKPITDSWIYVRVNKPDISVPLTPDERAERRKLLPKLEPIEYDDRGNRILRS